MFFSFSCHPGTTVSTSTIYLIKFRPKLIIMFSAQFSTPTVIWTGCSMGFGRRPFPFVGPPSLAVSANGCVQASGSDADHACITAASIHNVIIIIQLKLILCYEKL